MNNDRGQKMVRKALHVGPRRLLAMLEHSFDCVELVSAEGKICYASPSLQSLLGLHPDQWVGRSIFDRTHQDDLTEIRRDFQRLLQTPDATFTSEYRLRHIDGSFLWIEQRATNLINDADVQAIVINFRDITQGRQEKEFRRKLRQENTVLINRLRVQIERMPIGLIMTDADLRITDWNPASEKIFGIAKSDAMGKSLMDLGITPDTAHTHVQQVADDMTVPSLNVSVTRQGRIITCQWYKTPLRDSDGKPAGVLSMVIDVTERVRLEDQFRQAQKMEAIGMLASSVAHDFNNLLTVVSGCSELLVEKLSDQGELRSWAFDIHRASERAAELTDQLLSFSRKQLTRQEVIDVNEVLADIEPLLSRIVGEDIELVIQPFPHLARVRADKGQLGRVLINLVVNAREAMPRGGHLCISTSNFMHPLGTSNDCAKDQTRAIANVYPKAFDKVKPGNYVCLRVQDAGLGMAEAVIEQIFEPFFTTKEAGQGTGLGLATVHGIVTQCGGYVAVHSEPGRGAEFTILLPATDSIIAQKPVVHCIDQLGGTETILLVEDDDSLRMVAQRMLEQLGYQVIVAACGTEALDVVHRHSGRIDLLLTDVVMPGMSGKELFKRCRQAHPDLRILFMSGYTGDRTLQHGVSNSDPFFLQKPFNKMKLAHKISSAIQSPALS